MHSPPQTTKIGNMNYNRRTAEKTLSTTALLLVSTTLAPSTKAEVVRMQILIGQSNAYGVARPYVSSPSDQYIEYWHELGGTDDNPVDQTTNELPSGTPTTTA